MEHSFPGFLGFPGGDDNTGVRDGDPENRHDFSENIVVDPVVKFVGIDVVGRADSRHADGVRADALSGLQMLGVHQQAHKIIAVEVQAEQDAAAYVVDAAVHRPVHGLCVVSIVGSSGR